MDWIIRRFRIVISMSLILAAIITFTVVYNPMRSKLETATLQHFLSGASTQEQTAVRLLELCLEATSTFSHQADMRSLLEEFRAGIIDSKTLKARTQALYSDRAKLLPYAEGVFRFSEGMQIASFGEGNSKKLAPSAGVHDLTLALDEAQAHIIIYSPILHNGNHLGYDVFFFDLNQVIPQQNNTVTTLSIPGEEPDVPAKGQGKSISVGDSTLFDDGKTILYTKVLDNLGAVIQVKTQKEVLFAPIRTYAVSNLITALVSTILLMLLTNFVIIRFTQYKLSQTEKTKELYKEYAYRDALTGAYSRLFYDRWFKSLMEKSRFIHEDLCIVMIDINRYKSINDTYGHAAGDQALIRVAKILQSSLKEEDLVIRYGGDEFLLVIRNCRYAEADKTMVKINEKLLQIEDMGFGLSISYGITQIGSYKDLPAAIKSADQKMYESKNEFNRAFLWL